MKNNSKKVKVTVEVEVHPPKTLMFRQALGQAERGGKTWEISAALNCARCGNHELGKDCDIPPAPWYVVSTDSFMSGWGPAQNRNNICVVPCLTREIADRVLRYVKSRSEQKNARITKTRPTSGPSRIVSNLSDWIETSKRERS